MGNDWHCSALQMPMPMLMPVQLPLLLLIRKRLRHWKRLRTKLEGTILHQRHQNRKDSFHSKSTRFISESPRLPKEEALQTEKFWSRDTKVPISLDPLSLPTRLYGSKRTKKIGIPTLLSWIRSFEVRILCLLASVPFSC